LNLKEAAKGIIKTTVYSMIFWYPVVFIPSTACFKQNSYSFFKHFKVEASIAEMQLKTMFWKGTM
jgi:hypothetical protein